MNPLDEARLIYGLVFITDRISLKNTAKAASARTNSTTNISLALTQASFLMCKAY